MVPLPDILFEDKYKNSWEWDGWTPKAKEDAPQEVKDAIAKWKSEAGADEDGDDLIFQ